MKILFEARVVYCSTDNGVTIVGLADDAKDPHRYILFQQTVIPSEQDINLGFECPHITLNNETRSVYGGVERVALDDGSLCLCVSLD